MTVSVVDNLARWGPGASAPSLTLEESQIFCRDLAQSHYENFPVASWLLPKPLRQHFYNVYAFCRWSDDLGDEIGDPERSLFLLDWWRQELESCYVGRTTHPVFQALRPTIDRFSIPQQPFADLISAFVQDQHIHEYATFDELEDYCRRSANPVGRIVLYLCEQFDDDNARLADSVCTGLQLANFWQDVARDFEIGRVYLPREDRRRFGYSDEDLQNRVTNPPFVQLMQFEVERARQLLIDGLPLVSRMSGRLQVDIDLFIRGGLTILQAIECIGYRVWESRPVVSKLALARAAVRSMIRAMFRNTLWI